MGSKIRENEALDPLETVSKLTGGHPETAHSTISRAHRMHQKAIAQGLRKYFDSVAAEPIPEDFLDLLAKLDTEKKDGGS
jgi:hypothetical protein